MLSTKLQHIRDILKEINMVEKQIDKVNTHIKVQKEDHRIIESYINLAENIEKNEE
tara:strand:+ start:5141 stop:5308 length:168 start_codon:yes stop_codon:yes gene_type:complete